jgi:riboflavin synthase
MFSGIILSTAAVRGAEKRQGSLFLTIARPRGWQIKPGDSLATDGVCLTVAQVQPTTYTCELMPATLQRSSFG